MDHEIIMRVVLLLLERAAHIVGIVQIIIIYGDEYEILYHLMELEVMRIDSDHVRVGIMYHLF